MHAEPNKSADTQVTPDPAQRVDADARAENFEKRQGELWRLTFALLLIISVVFAWFSWDTIRTANYHLEALPIGLVVLVALFGVYIWRKTQQVAELRGMAYGVEHRDSQFRSEQQLQQLVSMISRSQEGFRDLIDSFDDILLAVNLDGEIRAVNKSFSDLLTLPFQQIIGLPLSQFFENAGNQPEEMLGRGMAWFLERRQWSGVVQVRLKKTNAVYFFECTAHAMIRDDRVHGTTILARDVSLARRNEARFTELFETLQEGIYIVTPEDNILDANPALVRMLGYRDKQELLSTKLPEIFVDEQQRFNTIREVKRQTGPQSKEITLRRKDGKPLICLNTATAIRDNAGKVVRFQGSLVDITERLQMEKQLHQQQEFARRLVDSFPDLIFVVDTGRKYTFISPNVKEVLGYESSETIGMTFGERTHPEDKPLLLSLFDDLLAGRKLRASTEIRSRHKLGEWRRIRCNFSPLFNESGKIEGVVISGRDVTEMKRLEEQLIQAEKLAAMGQMLAGVAHELNNPLTAILGASELLRDRPDLDESSKRQMEMTHRQARRAARIVQNLLEFSRPASPQKKPLDLSTVIDRTLQLHEHSLRNNNVQVEFRPETGLPPIIGDANQLIQVFLNLVNNAEQAIREVRTSGRIQIRLGTSTGRVFATVQDDGAGIKPEDVSKIFDPFFTTKRPGGGTGLGLSICMTIVREHGGNIEAESLPAGGAAFTVTLPAAGHEVRRKPLDPDRSSGEWMPPSLESLRNRSILVLDDEESIRMLLEEGLSAHGLKIESAGTAEQALALVLGRKFDAVLCDLKLAGSGPNSDGYSVAQRLKIAAGENKPEIIFMSGDLFGEDSAQPELARARRLQKPFRVSDVLNTLMEAFSATPVTSTKR